MSAHHSLPLLLLPLVAFGCSRDGPTSPQDRAPPAARSAARASAHQRIVVGHDRARCGHADFASIQAAVDAADPGETILVCPGTYNQWIVITKDTRIRYRPNEKQALLAAGVRASHSPAETSRACR